MTSALASLVLAAIATTVATPLVRAFATRMGVVDSPGGRRVHQHITPRLGGVAVIIGFFTPLALFAMIGTGAMSGLLEKPNLVVGLVLGSAIVCLVGAVDDVRSLGPWAKLGAQGAAAVVAYVFGYRIEAINIPLFGDLQMGVLALPVTVFWFLAITNALNLIDGLDGLAAGIALFATASNFAIAYFNGSDVVVLLSAALAGSLLGFLRYNFSPATIFLGDSGSMFLGFALAATALAGSMTKSSTAIAILAPMIALGVPIMDTLLAMIRRTLAHQSIFTADRGHIHHKLLDLGLTTRRVVLTLYGLSIALALSAAAIAFGRSWHVGAALSLVGALLFGIVRNMRRSTFERPAMRVGTANEPLAIGAPLTSATSNSSLRVAPTQMGDEQPT
jgi:UDP-GlcNAc:undecaprenyl-phosphate GlcNAc-1-phosphate transferase